MAWILAFSVISTFLVWLAGRKDAGCDPRLTTLLLGLLAVFPLMQAWMPKPVVISAMPAASGPSWPWAKMIFAIWAAGFLVAAARLAVGWIGLRRWHARSVVVKRISGVEVRSLAGLGSPVAAGVFRPVIFVPDTWHDWSAACRNLILTHELAHHRRRDPMRRWIAEIACAVHWYHPLVHWMSRRLAIQCEFACDAAVLKSGLDAKSYARTLCDFAEQRTAPALALAMASESSLESRIARMLTPGKMVGTATLVLLACAGLAASCALSMIRRGNGQAPAIPAEEVDLRWSANPFPAE